MWCGLLMLASLGSILTSSSGNPLPPMTAPTQICHNRLLGRIYDCENIIRIYLLRYSMKPVEDKRPLGNIVEECCKRNCSFERLYLYCKAVVRDFGLRDPVSTTTTTTTPPPPTEPYFNHRRSRLTIKTKNKERLVEDALIQCLKDPNCFRSKSANKNASSNNHKQSKAGSRLFIRRQSRQKQCHSRNNPTKPSSMLRLLVGLLDSLPRSPGNGEDLGPKAEFHLSDSEREREWGSSDGDHRPFENSEDIESASDNTATNQNSIASNFGGNAIMTNLVENPFIPWKQTSTPLRTSSSSSNPVTQIRRFKVPLNHYQGNVPQHTDSSSVNSYSDPPVGELDVGFSFGSNDQTQFSQ